MTGGHEAEEEEMKNLYIVGAGGCGREVLQTIKDINRIQGPRWNIMGFLDDTEDPLAGKACDYGVVGTIVDYQPKENDVLAMAVADPKGKRKLAEMLLARGAVFENIVHPGAGISEFVEMGIGNVLYSGLTVSSNTKIGNFTTLLGSPLGHDIQIGDYSTISAICNITGHVKIGEGVFIGGSCAIVPGTVIEDNAYVGMGSVVLRRVRAGKKVFGNPAREVDI